MNSLSGWLCSNSSKNLFVKIVHPGGHVELHDQPIQAAELLNRNPKCCVAYPTVFQEPYAIISPDTTLALGQKYYVVPIGTIRKLQLKHSPNLIRQKREAEMHKRDDEDETDSSDCWLVMTSCNKNKKAKKSKKSKCFQMSTPKIKTKGNSSSNRGSSTDSERTGNGSRMRGNNSDSSTGGASPARISLMSVDNWQPGLESITEEQM